MRNGGIAMKCPNCGRTLQKGQKYCNFCGAAVPEGTGSAQAGIQYEENSTLMLIMRIGTGVIALVALVALIFSFRNVGNFFTSIGDLFGSYAPFFSRVFGVLNSLLFALTIIPLAGMIVAIVFMILKYRRDQADIWYSIIFCCCVAIIALALAATILRIVPCLQVRGYPWRYRVNERQMVYYSGYTIGRSLLRFVFPYLIGSAAAAAGCWFLLVLVQAEPMPGGIKGTVVTFLAFMKLLLHIPDKAVRDQKKMEKAAAREAQKAAAAAAAASSAAAAAAAAKQDQAGAAYAMNSSADNIRSNIEADPAAASSVQKGAGPVNNAAGYQQAPGAMNNAAGYQQAPGAMNNAAGYQQAPGAMNNAAGYQQAPGPMAPQPYYAQPQIDPNNPATIPEELRPISMWGYFGYSLLFLIPFVGLVLLLVFSFGGTRNVNLRNFARSHFCALILGIILALLFSATLFPLIARLSYELF